MGKSLWLLTRNRRRWRSGRRGISSLGRVADWSFPRSIRWLCLGPVLGRDYATSIVIVQRLMDGGIPACPRLTFGVVDVRDVADLHLLAMTHPAAKGERFLAVAGDCISLVEMAKTLKNRMGAAARKVPTRQLPDWLLRAIAIFDPTVRQVVPELGNEKRASNEKARRVLAGSRGRMKKQLLRLLRAWYGLGFLKD